MRHLPSQENPFDASRYGYLWEILAGMPRKPRRHLDIGTRNGSTITQVMDSGLADFAVGVDVQLDSPPSSNAFVQVGSDATLPFCGESFDSCSMLDVLEHVPDQRALLAEVYRVLRPDGLFVVTVPQQHALSALDTGNLKFRFPQLHRRFISSRDGAEAYEARYGVTNAAGLVGDVSAEKLWHEHFTVEYLTQVLSAVGFAVVDIDGAGKFGRIFDLVSLVVGKDNAFLRRLYEIDQRKYSSVHLFTTSVRR